MLRITLLLVVLLMGCGPRKDETLALPPASDTDATPPPLPRGDTLATIPVQKEDTIVLEGMPEPMRFNVYYSPNGFPLRFQTYVPADMLTETVNHPDGNTVRFIANFGGIRQDSARLAFRVYNGGREQAFRVLEREADRLGAIPSEARTYPWSAREYRISGRYPGFMVVGERNGRVYHFLATYPEEYSEGFVPRANEIIDEWVWR